MRHVILVILLTLEITHVIGVLFVGRTPEQQEAIEEIQDRHGALH
jgi:hypothetical protein